MLRALGDALLVAGNGTEATAVFERAIQIEPNVALNYLHAGLAWKALHQGKRAAEYLGKALQLDPLLEQPYRELVELYSEDEDVAMLQQTVERYLKAFPKNIRAQKAFLNGSR